MTTEFFSFTDLNIKTGEIEELIGFEAGNSPAPFPELINEGIELAPEFCRIVGGYQVFDKIDVNLITDTIRINDTVFFPGKIVVTQLNNASMAALFLCTAGHEITELSHQKSAEGNYLLAYVLDVIGSVTVDKAAGMLQDKILNEVSLSGYGISDSFSPGYCNWSVAEQQKLFSLLPPGMCNISLSKSSLMHPVKSVSGITGIGFHCERTGYQCNWCNDLDCFYGKTKRHKKAKKNL